MGQDQRKVYRSLEGVAVKYVILRFILEYGSFIQTIVSEEEARTVIAGYIEGTLKDIIGNSKHPMGGWAVDVSSILGIHTMEIQQQAPGVRGYTSGHSPMS